MVQAVNLYVAAILILFSTLIQAELLPAILPGLNQYLPDLTLLVVIAWSLILPWQWSLPLSFTTGLVLDLMNPSTHLVGMNALLYILVSLVIGQFSHRRFSTGVLWAVPITFGVVIVYRIMLLLGQQIVGYNNLQLNIVTQVVIPIAVIDAALMLVVFVLIRAFSRIATPYE